MPPRYSYSFSEMEGVRVVEERCRLEGPTGGSDASASATTTGAGSGSGAELRQRLRVHDQAHSDAVLHMAIAPASSGYSSVPSEQQQGGMGRMLLTCSRDGIIKAWK